MREALPTERLALGSHEMRALLILALSLAACAPIDPNQPSRVKGDDDYVTGSNLPRRAGPSDASVMTKEQMEDLMRSRPGPMPAGGGM
jgi:hypothetical protein